MLNLFVYNGDATTNVEEELLQLPPGSLLSSMIISSNN